MALTAGRPEERRASDRDEIISWKESENGTLSSRVHVRSNLRYGSEDTVEGREDRAHARVRRIYQVEDHLKNDYIGTEANSLWRTH